jgi:hypothetical protein
MRFGSLKKLGIAFLTAIASALPLVGVQPAAAFVINGPPDLTVVMSSTPNPVPASYALTYTVLVGNVSGESCKPSSSEPICTQSGRPADKVAVTVTIPNGAVYYWGEGDHGFTCPTGLSSGPSVTCTGAYLRVDDWATLTLTYRAPATAGVISATATVDPNNLIAERYENNNSATVSTTVVASALP